MNILVPCMVDSIPKYKSETVYLAHGWDDLEGVKVIK